jgi:hypothetical protein
MTDPCLPPDDLTRGDLEASASLGGGRSRGLEPAKGKKESKAERKMWQNKVSNVAPLSWHPSLK